MRLIKAQRTAGTTVRLWGRDEDGKYEFELPGKPYFYVSADATLRDSRITSIEPNHASIFGDRLKKVYTRNPSDVPALREMVDRSWEADVPYARRVILDRGIVAGFDGYEGNIMPAEPTPVPIVIMSMDIECMSSVGMPTPEKDPVTCWSLCNETDTVTCILDDIDYSSSEGEHAILHRSSEKSLIESLSWLLFDQSCDVLICWNSSFDLEYLEKRAKAIGAHWDISGICDFDLLESYKKLYARRSYRLKEVALEEKLTDTLEEQVDYARMWREDKPGLIARNARHARWVMQIDQKRQIVSYYWQLKELAGLESLEGTLHNSVLLDTMFLRRAFAAMPSKEEHKHEPFEGAYVMQPKAGVHTGVAVWDVGMMYPSCLLDHVLDPVILREFRKEHKGWEGYKEFATQYVAKGEPTVLLDLLREIIAERTRLKNAPEHKGKYMAVKGVLNSVYGVLGHGGFRLYEPEIPAKVTELARNTIHAIKSQVEEWKYEVLAADTDSIFVKADRDAANEVTVKLNTFLETIGDFSIKLEHYCDSILFTGAKKRYCFLENGELEAKGFEVRRTDSSNYTRGIQERIMRMILEGKRDEVIPFLRQMVEGVQQAKLEDIAVSRGLSREVNEYTGVTQSYIKALKESGLEVKAGDSVKIIPAKNRPYGMCVFLDVSEIGKVQVNWEEVVRTQIQLKVENLLPLVGLSWNDVEGQERLI